ncbi:MAG: ABC transporter substrate-binding protein [Janthinobacterium lividum]
MPPIAISRRGLALGATATLLAAPRIARAADPVKVGCVFPSTGPAAEAGKLQLNGANLALEMVNEKGVLGRKMQLVVEDDQTTNPGAVLAFSRLSSQPDIAAFIGSVRSTQVEAMAPDVLKIGKPMMIGGTSPTLTHQGNKWLFRCRPNDSYSGKVIAAYGADDLQKKKWAIVYSSDAFGTNGAKALEAALKEKGITPVLMQGYTNNASDFSAVVLAVRQSGADVLGSYFTFESDLGIFARQLRQLGVRIPWIGSPSITNTTALNLAGAALYGTYGVADYTVDATPASKAFGAKYDAKHHAVPDNQSSWTFDAVNLLGLAINTAQSSEPEKIRAALLGIKNYAGAEGDYNFDANGDGLKGYNVVKNENGKIAFVRRIDVQD